MKHQTSFTVIVFAFLCFACSGKKEQMKLNPHLPDKEEFHTFLLDEENRVLLVGNPVRNIKLKKLYLDVIKNSLK